MPSMPVLIFVLSLAGFAGLIGNRSLCYYGVLYFSTNVFDERRVLRSAIKEELETSWRRTKIWRRVLSAVIVMAFAGYGLMATEEHPVTAFAYVYPFGQSAGLRAWNLDRMGRWHERGPDGREARVFDVTRRGTVNGCRGSLANEASQPGYVFFVPDVGCESMALMLARNGGPWSALGSISLVLERPLPND